MPLEEHLLSHSEMLVSRSVQGEEKRLRAYRHSLNGSNLERGAVQLDVSGVSLRFGGVQALSDVNVQVRQSEIHAVIGPNGAGKTSLINSVSGLYRPQRGSIQLHDGD